MNKQEEKEVPATKDAVINLVSRLFDRFYDTPERFFAALVETILEKKYSEKEVSTMVNRVIDDVNKTKITVADVIAENKGKTIVD